MSARSEALAEKLAAANQRLLEAVEASTPAQWKARCGDGDWSQEFAAAHAAESIGSIAGMVEALANGQAMPPVSMEQIDQMNAASHAAFTGRTPAEVAAMIRESSPKAFAMVAGLSDEQLDRRVQLLAGAPPLPVAQVIEMILIGHAEQHTQSILAGR